MHFVFWMNKWGFSYSKDIETGSYELAPPREILWGKKGLSAHSMFPKLRERPEGHILRLEGLRIYFPQLPKIHAFWYCFHLGQQPRRERERSGAQFEWKGAVDVKAWPRDSGPWFLYPHKCTPVSFEGDTVVWITEVRFCSPLKIFYARFWMNYELVGRKHIHTPHTHRHAHTHTKQTHIYLDWAHVLFHQW